MAYDKEIMNFTAQIVLAAVQSGKISTETKDVVKYFEEIYAGIAGVLLPQKHNSDTSNRYPERITEDNFDDCR